MMLFCVVLLCLGVYFCSTSTQNELERALVLFSESSPANHEVYNILTNRSILGDQVFSISSCLLDPERDALLIARAVARMLSLKDLEIVSSDLNKWINYLSPQDPVYDAFLKARDEEISQVWDEEFLTRTDLQHSEDVILKVMVERGLVNSIYRYVNETGRFENFSTYLSNVGHYEKILMKAVKFDNVKLVEMLLLQRPQDQTGIEAVPVVDMFQTAAVEARLEVFRFLLQVLFDESSPIHYLFVPKMPHQIPKMHHQLVSGLVEAVKKGKVDSIKVLLEFDPKSSRSIVNFMNDVLIFIFKTSDCSNLDIIKHLLQYIEANSQCFDMKILIIILIDRAYQYSQENIIRLLEKKYYDNISSVARRWIISSENFDQYDKDRIHDFEHFKAVLLRASQRGTVQAVRYLIDSEKQYARSENIDEFYIHLACAQIAIAGYTSFVDVLFREVDFSMRILRSLEVEKKYQFDKYNEIENLLILAARHGRKDIFINLFENGLVKTPVSSRYWYSEAIKNGHEWFPEFYNKLVEKYPTLIVKPEYHAWF